MVTLTDGLTNNTRMQSSTTMTKQAVRMSGWAAALLAMTLTSTAEVKLNDNFSIAGYVTGTASHSSGDLDGGGTFKTSTMEVDSMKLAAMAKFGPVNGTLSLHSFGSSDPKFLDAYATYDMGSGTTFTFGKFLSYLGFEAFDYPNMLQISYANSLAPFIPAYHSGVKVDYAGSEGIGVGLAVVDSVYPGAGYWEGDRDLENGAGFEAYLKYSKDTLTGFFAIAHNADDVAGDQTTYDVWVQYGIGKTTLAAEYCYSRVDGGADGYFWLLLAQQSFGKWSVTGRVSGGEDDVASAPGAEFTKYTLSPAVTLTDNLGFLFEYSWTKFDKTLDKDNESYLAAQFVFKF